MTRFSVITIIVMFAGLNVHAGSDHDDVGQSRFGEIIRRVGERPDGLPSSLIIKTNSMLVAIGDSITQSAKELKGFMTTSDAVVRSMLPGLSRGRFLTRGRGGDTAKDIAERMVKVLDEIRPTHVVLNTGVNDTGLSHGIGPDEKHAQYISQVEYMLKITNERGVSTILLAPTLYKEKLDSPNNALLLRYAASMKRSAEMHGCIFVDTHDMFRRYLAEENADETTRLVTRDGIHLNPLGQDIMAVGLLRGLGLTDEEILAVPVIP